MKLVLLVDDHLDTTDYLREKLKQFGYQADVARDGEQALAMVGPQYAAVILDYHLPLLMGDAVCARMRANLALSHVPIVFITADGARDLQHLLEPGLTVCIEKALSTADLARVLDELTSEPQAA